MIDRAALRGVTGDGMGVGEKPEVRRDGVPAFKLDGAIPLHFFDFHDLAIDQVRGLAIALDEQTIIFGDGQRHGFGDIEAGELLAGDGGLAETTFANDEPVRLHGEHFSGLARLKALEEV